jgi:hypothetical protein
MTRIWFDKSYGLDWLMAGKSSRPSPAYIERLFTEKGFEVHRYFDQDLNTSWHSYT